MKCVLCLLLAMLIVVVGCAERSVNNNVVGDRTEKVTIALITEPTIQTATTTTIEDINEILCGCEVCKNHGIFVEHYLGRAYQNGVFYEGKVWLSLYSCSDFYFAELALQLVTDLYNDYEEAIEQIKLNMGDFFCLGDVSVLKKLFSAGLISINEIRAGGDLFANKDVAVFASFEGYERRDDGLCIEFMQSDELIIKRIHFTHGH